MPVFPTSALSSLGGACCRHITAPHRCDASGVPTLLHPAGLSPEGRMLRWRPLVLESVAITRRPPEALPVICLRAISSQSPLACLYKGEEVRRLPDQSASCWILVSKISKRQLPILVRRKGSPHSLAFPDDVSLESQLVSISMISPKHGSKREPIQSQ